jgi:Protein of unknown function (DUF2384)
MPVPNLTQCEDQGATMSPAAQSDELEVIMRLLQHMPVEHAARWLDRPNDGLAGQSPAHALQAGNKVAVLRLIEGTASAA